MYSVSIETDVALEMTHFFTRQHDDRENERIIKTDELIQLQLIFYFS